MTLFPGQWEQESGFCPTDTKKSYTGINPIIIIMEPITPIILD